MLIPHISLIAARNNILTAISQAGISIWASRNVVVAHNTIWQAQENTQSCILINAYSHDDAPSGSILTSSANLTIWANLLVRSATARAGPVLQIRADGLDPATPFVSNYNVYYDQKGGNVSRRGFLIVDVPPRGRNAYCGANAVHPRAMS